LSFDLTKKTLHAYALFYFQQIQEDFNIFDLIFELRKQRPSAVQTKVTLQFLFIYLFFFFALHR